MTERRYSEAEVTAIFRHATEAQRSGPSPPTPTEGLTLAQLQEIGREVGIAPGLVTEAARALDGERRPATRRFLGLPIGVGRSMELPRRLSEAEWEHLVIDLRQTFDAHGTVRSDGPFRQWTNGNLHVLLEPSGAGHRLRLQTFKGSAFQYLTAGFATAGLSGILLVALTLLGRGGDAVPAATLMGLLGIGLAGFGALQLPGWARRRRAQMEAVTRRLTASLADPSASQEP